MEEVFYTCPYCFSEVSVLVDLSVREQSYIEDCERCCNPIEFSLQIENSELVSFNAEAIGQ
ncbi:CPXCG motif-containing cysteine-rich protein [Croceimicrobium hydrocarbonivorans]|uniref:CPXCG motif-containing cysteine-rich protein n=1 Tax=Croceimicrobium hydrocarbonivorans TaxID=2761580 RepID=A0A7H0VEI4_9FLAO|nr:CPXCG motif-containing cysteine-rich protein [Croceimicrobium hydrocarbonivorans]QNR24132.1 CPXCG motif-containing cysteine-rich protein [Croceimicrobium hydrocarbonivorans]